MHRQMGKVKVKHWKTPNGIYNYCTISFDKHNYFLNINYENYTAHTWPHIKIINNVAYSRLNNNFHILTQEQRAPATNSLNGKQQAI
jgi:hypothetical protein